MTIFIVSMITIREIAPLLPILPMTLSFCTGDLIVSLSTINDYSKILHLSWQRRRNNACSRHTAAIAKHDEATLEGSERHPMPAIAMQPGRCT